MDRIIAENVSKRFKIGRKTKSGLARFVSMFSGKEPKKSFWALKDVSFSIKKGEIVGIIGENGSGKSTLLRIIAGVYAQDEGKVHFNGRIVSLINLYVGLQERLTMQDNIYLCCSLFGLNRREISERFNSIVEFSELEEFVNTKLYQFSNGMLQRLSFSIAVHCEPDILLLDEVFEVGDESFKKKSVEKIKELVSQGGSVILVSHDLNIVKKYCDRVIWIDEGKFRRIGKAGDVVREYLKDKS